MHATDAAEIAFQTTWSERLELRKRKFLDGFEELSAAADYRQSRRRTTGLVQMIGVVRD
jgi:hypothetical protein